MSAKNSPGRNSIYKSSRGNELLVTHDTEKRFMVSVLLEMPWPTNPPTTPPTWTDKLRREQHIKKYGKEFITIEGFVVKPDKPDNPDDVTMDVYFRTPAVIVDNSILNENVRVLHNVICNPRYVPYDEKAKEIGLATERITIKRSSIVGVKRMHELFKDDGREFLLTQLLEFEGFKGFTNKVKNDNGEWKIKFGKLYVYYDPVPYEY